MTDLSVFAELARLDHGLCVLSTSRRDGSVVASVVNAGVLQHPLTGVPVVGFVARGLRKLDHLRADTRATIVARAASRWAAVEGSVGLTRGLVLAPPNQARRGCRMVLDRRRFALVRSGR